MNRIHQGGDAGQPTTERRRAVVARLDADFFACLHDPAFRKQLRRVLIARVVAVRRQTASRRTRRR
jgi:hypothetical protein